MLDMREDPGLISFYLPESVHLLLVSASQSDPSPPSVGVVHLLRRHPRLWATVRRDGDAVLPP